MPLYPLLAADNGARLFGSNRFWLSAAAVAGVSLGCLGLTTLLLARTWRDRPKSVRAWHRLRFWRRSARIPSAKRAALRRRLLAINPLFWLAARQPVSAPVFMFLAVVLTLITVYVTAPYFARTMGAGMVNPMLGYLFAWLWTGLAIHALVLYYAAMSASQRLAEDKQTGALELVLCTPTTERTISRGLWLAYARKMLFPALLAVLVHCVLHLDAAGIDDARSAGTNCPRRHTRPDSFGAPCSTSPSGARSLDWQFGFILRIPVLILLQLMLTWPTLGWVGRWLGLRMKHPGFAPMASLALLFAPPVLLFSLACYLADKFDLNSLPERQFLPLMMWLALAIGSGHCLVLSVWAATRLRHRLRPVAMSRYQPLPPWRWRLPSWRAVRRSAIGAAAFAALVALLVASYYGYQNWRSKRAWQNFQTALRQGGESLNLSLLLPEPAPDDANFARSPAFLGLLSKTNRETSGLFERLRSFDLAAGGPQAFGVLIDWSHQTNSPLQPFASAIARASVPASPGVRGSPKQPRLAGTHALPGKRARATRDDSGTNRTEDATAILEGLQSQSGMLRELAAAAARFPAFQTSTNRSARAVLHPVQEQTLLLERLHLLFQVRACASLALGRNADAAEDVLAGLRLARLARQLPDVRSTVRVQVLLTRSLQPVWEGLRQHAWSEPQLAALQRELAGLDLLADYTNAVRRVVLAHIETWRAVPDSTNSEIAVLSADGDYSREPAWRLEPRAWWYESCIQLHNAGRNAIGHVDVATGRIQPAVNWSDLDGLPLDPASRDLLLQSAWWGAYPASVAFVQTSVNQAVIACALERFRLANSGYPKTLDQFVPALLARVPHDAVSGRRIIYQRVGDGHFILRGVGPNGLDDRKKPASDDWLWTYSTNTFSAKK